MTDQPMKYLWNCVICDGAVAANGLDPCAISIVTNADRPWYKRRRQTFFCHIECFAKLKGVSSMYILDDDFPVLADLPVLLRNRPAYRFPKIVRQFVFMPKGATQT
jgi:hypothetical protein